MGGEQTGGGKHTLVGRFAGPGITALAGGGVQLTGYQNEWLGYALFIVAAIWALVALVASLRGRYRERQEQPRFLDLAAPDAKPKQGHGIAQEGDQPPRSAHETWGRGWYTLKLASKLRPVAVQIFEPLELIIRAVDLPAPLRSKEHHDLPILTVHRFIDGGIVIEEQSRGVVVRYRPYFGDEDWEPPRPEEAA